MFMLQVFTICLSLLLLAAAPAKAALPAEVTVDIFRAHPAQSEAGINGPLEVVSPRHIHVGAGSYKIIARQGQVALATSGGASRKMLVSARTLVLKPLTDTLTVSLSPALTRRYHGMLICRAENGNQLSLSNVVHTSDYVHSVVASESLPQFPQEALKAQAVLTQTRLARYKPGDRLNDTTEGEAYLGATQERQAASEAADSVWSQILTYHGLPASVYYHSTCGGGTSSGEDLFLLKPHAFPYLRPIKCNLCHESPFFKNKSATLPIKKFETIFGTASPIIEKSDATGRPLVMRLSNSRTVTGWHFWQQIGRSFGWDKVPGTRYKISSGQGGQKDYVIVESNGAGHGVGMCQWGAGQLARQGKSYKDILQYYFPGTAIVTIK